MFPLLNEVHGHVVLVAIEVPDLNNPVTTDISPTHVMAHPGRSHVTQDPPPAPSKRNPASVCRDNAALVS